jgi:hypothetical protein
MNVLYTSPKGNYPVTRHSYSAGQIFRGCARRYQLEKIKGYREKEKRAALEFGNCTEAAVKYFHEGGCKPSSGVDEFKRLWLGFKDNKELVYGDKEGDWSDLYRAGGEMLALYEIKWPTFGYFNPKFQKSFTKEVFPGTELAGLEFTAYTDILAETEDVDHTSSPRTKLLVIDMKTSGAAPPKRLRLDAQLRSYAWVSGIPDVAFLWMQKNSSGSYKRGDRVSSLVDGREWVVLAAPQDSMCAYLIQPQDLEHFDKELEGLKGKALEQKKAEHLNSPAVHVHNLDAITKQRITFHRVRIPDDDAKQQGEIIGQEIADIHHANKRGVWPQTGAGVRWPNDRCNYCPMLGICDGDEALVKERLVHLPSSNQGATDNWIDGI